MTTEHGRHGQRMTVQKWLNFGDGLGPDLDLGSVFHFP